MFIGEEGEGRGDAEVVETIPGFLGTGWVLVEGDKQLGEMRRYLYDSSSLD